MSIRLLSVGIVLLLTAAACAQWARNPSIGTELDTLHPGDQASIVHGQISSENPLIGSLTVELIGPGPGGLTTASLDLGGAFEFHGLAQGQYELRLMGPGGLIVYQEPVLITGAHQNLSIQIPTRSKVGKPSEATVSIRQLQHKVPAEAQKEFNKGTSLSAKGDHSSALEHFRKAVNIDPEFANAFNGLGASYAAVGQLREAADQFQKAITLVPDYTLALANVSIVLCKLEDYQEAGEAARRALKLDPTLLKIRYILGLSLVNEGGDKVEALDNLQRAAVEIPKAHLLAAQILIESDRHEEAVRHVEEYLLSSPANDSDRQKAGAWLDQLRR